MASDRDIDALTSNMPGEDKAEFFDLQVGGGFVDPRHARTRPSEYAEDRSIGSVDD